MTLTDTDYSSKVGIRDWNPAMIPFGGSRRNGRLPLPVLLTGASCDAGNMRRRFTTYSGFGAQSPIDIRYEIGSSSGMMRDSAENAESHENRIHWFRMKNITLSADEDLIERARTMARGQRRTLNAAFREWLTQFTQSAGDVQGFDGLMKHLKHIDAGRRFSRDEMNER
jgi:hypothetical protein